MIKLANTILETFTEGEREKGKMVRKEPKRKNLKAKFPLQKGDILIMVSGEQYIVQHFCVHGIYHIEQYSLVSYDPLTSRPSSAEKIRFSTLRELNEYAKQNRKHIADVLCNGPRMKVLTIDECHEQAIIIEQARERLRSIFQKNG